MGSNHRIRTPASAHAIANTSSPGTPTRPNSDCCPAVSVVGASVTGVAESDEPTTNPKLQADFWDGRSWRPLAAPEPLVVNNADDQDHWAGLRRDKLVTAAMTHMQARKEATS